MSTITEHRKLLRCPFCGAEAELERSPFHESIVKCTNDDCGAKMDGCSSMEKETVSAWNKRPGITISKEALELAASALDGRIREYIQESIPRAHARGNVKEQRTYERWKIADQGALQEINKAIAESKTE